MRSSIRPERGAALTGGVDSPVRAGKAVGGRPPFLSRAKGSRVADESGRWYVDYLCAYGPVLLGHADPRIADAIASAASDGLVFGATHDAELRLAERVRGHMPAMASLRFVSTGTEACMSAIRVARGFTGRERFVRFAGNYHGHSDEMIFSAGASANSSAAIGCGVPPAVASRVSVLPYNDLEALAHELARFGDGTAAVIMEPVVGNMGLVLPLPGFLPGVRTLCDRYGVLLVFDEVITGFRLGLGGATQRYGVTPDLTCIGKALGGGMPIAAFGGREDVMRVLAPQGSVFVGGTFSGNPICVAAAHVLLDALESDAAFYERVEVLAAQLADGLRSALRDAGLPYPVVQLGSIVDFMFRPGPAHRNYAEAAQADAGAHARYFWRMLELGVHLPPSPMEVMFLTGAHDRADIDETIAAARQALQAAEARPAATIGAPDSLRS